MAKADQGRPTPPPKAPKSTTPLAGCRRCRGSGAILVLLRRQSVEAIEYALRCSCAASANYSGLPEIGRFCDGWSRMGATIIEWPTIAERKA